VAHRARLIFGGLVMGRSRGPLSGKCVALQAQQVHLAHAQIARVGRTVGRVTTTAALSLHRYMFENERPLLVGVALHTDRVPTRHGPHLSERGRTMYVVAVAALDETFVYAMMIWLREIGFGGNMTSIAELGLCLNEEVLRLLGVVRRVAVQAANIVARVRRCREVSLLVLFTVTTQATGVGILLRHRRKANDLGNIPSAFYVRGSGTVTRLTTVSVVQRSFEMRCALEVIFVQLFMTGLASVNSNILSCFLLGGSLNCYLLGGSAALFLGGGMGGPKHSELQNRYRCQPEELQVRSTCLHGRTPRFGTSVAVYLAILDTAAALSGFHLDQVCLLESLDVLSNGFGLLVVQPSDTLVVWCLTS
jgi:hypothetical protein